MLTYAAGQRDYQDAGSLSSLLAPSSFIADDVFLTKLGHVGMAWQLRGVDSEGLTYDQRAAVAKRFDAAVLLLDSRFRLYSYLVKSPAVPLEAPAASHPVVAEALAARTAALNSRGGDLFETALYIVITYEDVTADAAVDLGSVFRLMGLKGVVDDLDQKLVRAEDTLRHAAEGFEAHLGDVVEPRRLHKADIFRFFRRLVTYDGPDLPLKYDDCLDYFIADAAVTAARSGAIWDVHRVQLHVGSHRVAVLTMKEAPSATFAGLLDDLAALPVSCIACLEWHRIPNDVMRRDLTTRMNHYLGIKTAKAAESVEAKRAAHADAILEMDVHGRSFGECSLTLVLHHPDADRVTRATAEARKLLAVRDGCFIEETFNLLYAWASIMPGNYRYNLRRLPLLDTHCADLAFLFAPDAGDPQTAVAVLEARHGARYYYALKVEDVGHTLVLGKTGAGKSFFLNVLLLHLQAQAAHTCIFDLGHSYRTLTTALGGSYVELGPASGVTINPFSLPPGVQTYTFLHAFVRVLIDGQDGYIISGEDDRALYEAITHLYVLRPELRQLRHLMVPRALKPRLAPWVEDGRYAAMFDHVEDTLDVAPFQTFDFDGMSSQPQLVEAVVFYILHRLNMRLQARVGLTVCVMDEAWRFIKHPKLRDYVEEALKTWRKMDGAMILATQAVDDFLASDLQRTVIESCHTKFLLANPDLHRDTYAQAFGLNERELELVTGLIPKRQIFLKRQAVSKVLDVRVDPQMVALCAAGKV